MVPLPIRSDSTVDLPVSETHGPRGKPMLRTAFVLALSLSSGAALACDGAKSSAEAKSQCHMTEAQNRVAAMEGAIPASATLVHYNVDGVECGNCAKEIRTVLESTPGVTAALVNTDKGTI